MQRDDDGLDFWEALEKDTDPGLWKLHLDDHISSGPWWQIWEPFRAKLRSGELTAWGFFNESHTLEPIDRLLWDRLYPVPLWSLELPRTEVVDDRCEPTLTIRDVRVYGVLAKRKPIPEKILVAAMRERVKGPQPRNKWEIRNELLSRFPQYTLTKHRYLKVTWEPYAPKKWKAPGTRESLN